VLTRAPRSERNRRAIRATPRPEPHLGWPSAETHWSSSRRVTNRERDPRDRGPSPEIKIRFPKSAPACGRSAHRSGWRQSDQLARRSLGKLGAIRSDPSTCGQQSCPISRQVMTIWLGYQSDTHSSTGRREVVLDHDVTRTSRPGSCRIRVDDRCGRPSLEFSGPWLSILRPRPPPSRGGAANYAFVENRSPRKKRPCYPGSIHSASRRSTWPAAAGQDKAVQGRPVSEFDRHVATDIPASNFVCTRLTFRVMSAPLRMTRSSYKVEHRFPGSKHETIVLRIAAANLRWFKKRLLLWGTLPDHRQRGTRRSDSILRQRSPTQP
jgi:hypothetical protein